jgi:hypothetical protein
MPSPAGCHRPACSPNGYKESNGGESGTGALMGRITRPGHRIRRQPLGDPGTRAVLRGGLAPLLRVVQQRPFA